MITNSTQIIVNEHYNGTIKSFNDSVGEFIYHTWLMGPDGKVPANFFHMSIEDQIDLSCKKHGENNLISVTWEAVSDS